MSTRKDLIEKQNLADTDLLTGLLNRNCFERRITLLPSDCSENLTCIYADANGLHELNNTKGHTAGDKMLQEVAMTIQNHFGKDYTYRIGGDEFVAFAKDEAQEVIRKKLTEINARLSELGYHVSIGVCTQSLPIDTDSLIKQAETEMYAEKKRYYQETGKDRRHRQ